MPIEVYEVVDGQRVDMPSGATSPGAGGQADEPGAGQTDAPGATDTSPAGDVQPSASPPDTPPAPSGEGGADTEDDEPLRDDSEVNAERLNRRFARLTAARRKAERQVEAERQQHALEIAQLRGQQEAVQRMLSGAAPELTPTPAPPTGPPQAEQFERHEEFVQAAANYAVNQSVQQQRQIDAQTQFQHALMSREQAFKAEHPDFDQVVHTGLAGKVSPVLQQALMLVPDGPAVAYRLAQMPDLVHRLNTLPPPLVLVELGRLSPPQAPTNGTTPGTPQTPTNGTTPALPAPPTPLSGAGAGAPTGTYSDSMSQREYEAWRKRTSQLPVWKER